MDDEHTEVINLYTSGKNSDLAQLKELLLEDSRLLATRIGTINEIYRRLKA